MLKQRVRSVLLPLLESEPPYLVSFQSRYGKSLAWDKFMANAGFVGTHTFYLLFLPLLRWIELGQSVVIEMKQERWVDPFTSWILSVFYNDSLELDVEMKGVRMDFAYFVGRDLIILLALGVYVSGFVKDWLSLPRPPSPPVKRLSKCEEGAHLEYGFPSTHTTNVTITAIFMFLFLYNYANLSAFQLCITGSLLALYAGTVSWSRIYCGLHSMTDVAGGFSLGVGIALSWWYISKIAGLWSVVIEYLPVYAILGALLFIYIHPHPEGPCPCFEDSISFVGVVGGVFFGTQQFILQSPIHSQTGIAMFSSNTGSATTLLNAILRVGLGLTVLVVWRMVMKKFWLTIVPGVIKKTKKVSHGRNRSVDAEKSEMGSRGRNRYSLRARKDNVGGDLADDLERIPSEYYDDYISKKKDSFEILNESVNGKLNGRLRSKSRLSASVRVLASKNATSPYRLHKWSLDIFTKVFVYFGIGYLVTHGIPVLFNYLGI